MLLLIGFSFLAGIFTVLSPCILPILPALLSASVLQGRLRPLGIIAGLVTSFTFFTLALTAIVHATGISPDILRTFAIILIVAFGLIMIFPTLSDLFARWTASIASLGNAWQKRSKDHREGFWGGFLFGIALGLLWTPCAGPILAAITTLVATQAVSFDVLLITIAYGVGAGIPMFLISYGGGKAIQSSRALSKYSLQIRQLFGVVMILSAVAIALHWDMILQQKVISYFPSFLIEDNPYVKNELNLLRTRDTQLEPKFILINQSAGAPIYGKAPELTGIVNWINSPPLSLMNLKGKVVLIDFWTYSCINCLRTLPYIEKWYQEYKDKGFVVIGVHTPEFEFEKTPANVADAVARLGILYPVAQDNDYATWLAYQNQYWPAHYLIDQSGNVRQIHFGEGDYIGTENVIRELLGLSPLIEKEQPHLVRSLSPETYLGLSRAIHYTKSLKLVEGTVNYDPPLADDQVGLRGKWGITDENIISQGNDSYIDGEFLATEVYLVLSGSSNTPVEVFVDGKPSGSFLVKESRKYDVARFSYGRHLVSLKLPSGISAYAFTFGDD